MCGLIGPSVGPAKREEQISPPWEVRVQHKLPELHHLVLHPVPVHPPPQAHSPPDCPKGHSRLHPPALVQGARPGTYLEVEVAGRNGVVNNLRKENLIRKTSQLRLRPTSTWAASPSPAGSRSTTGLKENKVSNQVTRTTNLWQYHLVPEQQHPRHHCQSGGHQQQHPGCRPRSSWPGGHGGASKKKTR